MFLSFQRNITGNTLLPASDYAEKRVQSYDILSVSANFSQAFFADYLIFSYFCVKFSQKNMHIGYISRVLPLAAAALLAGCSSQQTATVASVERSRILVDSRYDAAPDAEAAEIIEPYRHVVDSIMSPIVGRSAGYMSAQRPESDLSNLLADILVWVGRDYGEQPVMGVYNMGGIRAALPEGDVTYGDVLEVAPFENKICFLTLTGSDLLELFRNMASVGGEGVSHGVELVITGDGRLTSARLNGQEIDPEANYRIATIDYLAQGNDKMEAFKKKKDFNAPAAEENDTRYIISAYFREMARQGKTVESKVEGRTTVR